MRRLSQSSKVSLLLVLLAGLVLPQSYSGTGAPSVRRVGDRLACKCGSCNNTVATCQMLECHYSHPAREKIVAMQQAGKSDDDIVESMVKEEGLSALASPPAHGFNLLGYWMPYIALLLGLGAIYLYVKRFHGRRPQPVGPPVSQALLDRYQDQMDKETAKLD